MTCAQLSWFTVTGDPPEPIVKLMLYGSVQPYPNGPFVAAANELYVRVRSNGIPRPATAMSSNVCQKFPSAVSTGLDVWPLVQDTQPPR